VFRTHDAFETHLPRTPGAPRVLVYTNKALGWRRPLDDGLKHVVAVVSNSTRLVGAYYPPDDLEALREVVGLRADKRQLIVAGDFNAHHEDWDPGRPANARGRRLAEWAREAGLEPSLVATPTYWQGYTIDNVFTPLGMGTATCPPCEVRSDYRLVEITVPTLASPTTLPTRLRVPLKRYDNYLRVARRGLEAVPDLSLAPSNEEADRQASRITDTLRLAAEAVSSKHRNVKA